MAMGSQKTDDDTTKRSLNTLTQKGLAMSIEWAIDVVAEWYRAGFDVQAESLASLTLNIKVMLGDSTPLKKSTTSIFAGAEKSLLWADGISKNWKKFGAEREALQLDELCAQIQWHLTQTK